MTDIPSLLVNFGILVVSGVAAVAAVVAVRFAKRAKLSEQAAEEARDAAAASAASALERSTLIAQASLEAQRLALPAPWGSPVHRGGSDYGILNESGRTMIVTDLDTYDGGRIHILVKPQLPARVEHGDYATFVAFYGGNRSTEPNIITLKWHYEDDPTTETTTTRRM